MKMTRRSFLKSLAALAGVSAVPALDVVLPSVPEPIWTFGEDDFGWLQGVGAQWGSKPNMIRHAVAMSMTNARKMSEQEIEWCKQALRQWYYERHVLRKAA